MKKGNKEIKKEADIDMNKYRACETTVEACKGCQNEFNFEANVVNPTNPEEVVHVRSRKCLCYEKPSTKWPQADVGYATKKAVVRERDSNGKATGLVEKEIPVVDHRCVMATHVIRPEIVNTNVKHRTGQGRTKQGGNL